MRKFDINQIETGLEIPKEWNITDADMLPPKVMHNDITEDRDRVKALGEVFTPTSLIEFVLDLLEKHDPASLKNKSNTFIDSMCGDGQFLVGTKSRKIKNGIDEATTASTIYGIDLTQSNIDSSIKRIDGLDTHIVCADSLGPTFTIDRPKKSKKEKVSN
jgi:type I restriction-modification system DNA methylase subunit